MCVSYERDKLLSDERLHRWNKPEILPVKRLPANESFEHNEGLREPRVIASRNIDVWIVAPSKPSAKFGQSDGFEQMRPACIQSMTRGRGEGRARTAYVVSIEEEKGLQVG